MRIFRHGKTQTWLKGNTHIHSVASDGGKTFPELAGMYASAGYDFLFRTDRWAASDTARDTETAPLLWLDGIELDGADATGAARSTGGGCTCSSRTAARTRGWISQ